MTPQNRRDEGKTPSGPSRRPRRRSPTLPNGRRDTILADSAFRRDLYRGTVHYYDAYRYSYPQVLAEDLMRRVGNPASGRLLDLACGTGQVTFLLAPFFASVVGVDQEPDMVAVATRKADEGGFTHVRFMLGAVESVDVGAEPFTLITVGNAYHRLPRELTAKRMRGWLAPAGHVALVWAHTPWNGPEPWQDALRSVIEDWQRRSGGAERVPRGWDEARAARSDRAVLEDAGFAFAGRYTFPVAYGFAVEHLVGFAYSTSLLGPLVLADAMPAFAEDVARTLRPFVHEGRVSATIRFAYELFRLSADR